MIIILNGPPASGKDTIGMYMLKHGMVDGMAAFKDWLYMEAAEYFSIPVAMVVELATNRETKDKPHWAFAGKSPRQALIHVSELYIKPTFGNGFFGLQLSRRLHGKLDYVITDGGFVEEMHPLIEAGFDLKIVRLHRDGCGFANDSRRYLEATDFPQGGVEFFDVYNNSTVEQAAENIGIMVLRDKE
jgi:hypothetical protein